MKSSIKTTAVAATLILAGASLASAQSRSGYFTDNYTYGFQLNPAFGNDRGFFSLPGAGNLNLGTHGNVGIDNFIYKGSNGKTITFLSPEISAKKFLNGLGDHTRFGFNTKIGIMSVGFKAFHGYNTISVSANAEVAMRAPKGIFTLLKQGLENRSYDIANFDARINAYAEIALNHSHQITDNLRVGASLKLLVGGGNIDLDMEKAHLTLGEDNWKVETNAKIQSNLLGMRYKTSRSKETGNFYVDGVDFDSSDLGIGGYGIAVDLGAVYRLNDDWRFSLAFNDLGFIKWKNNMVASTQGTRTFNLNKYVFDPDDMDATFDDMKDELATLYQLDDLGDTGGRNRALAATLNVGVEYALPVYRKLTFGLLNTTRMAGKFSWTDFRLSANICPIKYVSAAVNYGIGTFGSSFGWIFNLTVPGFNVFVSMDHTLGKLSKQYIPINPNAQISLGVNFLIH